MRKKVVVFGGTGFLGSHVADALSEKGYEVIIFDKKESPNLRQKQEMFIGDLLDYDSIREATEGADYVYHFAGVADIDDAKNKPVETVKTNVLGTTYILEACRCNNVKRFLFASTVYVYSEWGSFYRSSKQACELLIENYQKIYGLDFTVLRYGSLYGRRANDFNFIRKIIKQALTDGKIVRLGDGEEIRDYVNVCDAARASVEILGKDFKNSYVMITGNQPMRVKDLLNMISEIMENKIKIEYRGNSPEEHYEITPYTFRPRVAKKYVLNYYHDLGQGILDCIYDTYKTLSKTGEKAIITPKSLK